LSLGGCYLDTINPLPEGTSVRVRITKGEKTFEALALVRYALPGMGMGIAFTEVHPDQQRVLKGWLDALNEDGAPNLGVESLR
jgi:hypothetical protein